MLVDPPAATGTASLGGAVHGTAATGVSRVAARADHVHPVRFAPGASNTPTNNNEVTFELTNNTTITFRARGSDGTVRSATITLS